MITESTEAARERKEREWRRDLEGAATGNPYATLCYGCMGRHRPPRNELCPYKEIDLEQQAREERPNMGWFDIAVDNKGNVWVLDYSSDWNAFAIEPHWEDNFEIDAPSHLAPGAYRWSNFLVGSWGDDDAIAIRGGDFTSLAFRAAQPGEGERPRIDRAMWDALPDPVKRYIMYIETDADPSGTIRSEMFLRDTVVALEAKQVDGLWHCTACMTEFQYHGEQRPNCPHCKAWDQYTYQGHYSPRPDSPALVKPRQEREAAGSLAKRCDEILSWRKTGIYEGTELAEFAARAGRVDDGSDPGPYRWAEDATIREALEVCAGATPQRRPEREAAGVCICEVAFGQNEDCPTHGIGTAWRQENPEADMRAAPSALATPQRRPEREALARIIDPTSFGGGVGYSPRRAREALAKADAAILALLPSEDAWREERAITNVIAERCRQIAEEDRRPEFDDVYTNGELCAAASAYLTYGHNWEQQATGCTPIGLRWPWHICWWKPKDRRRNLVRAAALIIAEIERLDRATISEPQEQGEEE